MSEPNGRESGQRLSEPNGRESQRKKYEEEAEASKAPQQTLRTAGRDAAVQAEAWQQTVRYIASPHPRLKAN